MKKTFYALVIALIAVVIVLVFFIEKLKPCNCSSKDALKPLLPPSGVTLNGVSGADANTMVKNFRDDMTSSHKRTAIFLKINWVRNIYRIVHGEGGDGIRIYFAKRKDNQFNTVVIVSTKYLQDDPNAESGADHQDYFSHSDPFLSTSDASLSEDWTEDYTKDPGAAMYSPNPGCANDDCSINILNYISCQEATADVLNFYTQGIAGKQIINTYSEWFPLPLFAQIIKEFDAELSQNPKFPADGIRIYFAKNIDKATNQRHKNRHNFIIVTTQADGATHQDYYKCFGNSISNWRTSSNDNGEQCLNNCNGATLPTS